MAMRAFLFSLSVLTAFLYVGSAKAADSYNVALHADVFLEQGPYFVGGWCCGKQADPATIVDGDFFNRSWQWDQGPVWWDIRRSAYPDKQQVIIDLGDIYTIDSFIVQADDNDKYLLYYWNLATNTWSLAWYIPAAGGWGMQTRPNRYDNEQRYMLPASIETDMLLFKGYQGDGLYSVSEIQAFGYPAVKQVAIDIKPGSDQNPINISSKGVIPVAILTTDEFDAADVDPATIFFGPFEAYAEQNALEDVDDDGDIDMILHFRTQDTGIALEDTEAVLTGETFEGRKIEGSDIVSAIERKGSRR